MKNDILKKVISFSTLFLPVLASAQFDLSQSTFRSLILQIISVIGLIIPILIAGSFIVFFWGLSRFITNTGSATEIEKGRNYMLWGILALFILLSFRGIIYFFSGEFQFGEPDVSGVLLPTTFTP